LVKKQITELSANLQLLKSPKFSKKVEEAVEKNDKNTLLKICKNAKIPSKHHASILSVLMSVSPQQKYPDFM
jgi:hypothetical protein